MKRTIVTLLLTLAALLSLGFREDGYRHAYGVDFLRMVYTV